VALAGRGQVDEAIAHFQQAVKIKPEFAEAHNNLGKALAGRGQVDEAIAHYEEALKIKPDYESAHNNLGLALADRGQIDAAIAHFQQAVKIEPEFAEAYNNLGVALVRRGQVDAAIAHFQQALQIKPDYESAHNNLGLVLPQQGDTPRRSLSCARRSDSCPTTWSRLTNWHGVGHLSRRIDPQRGRGPRVAQRAVQLRGGREPVILDTLAAAYAEAGRFSEAVKTTERAISLASDRGDTALADTLRTRLRLYRAGSPYHETPDQRHK